MFSLALLEWGLFLQPKPEERRPRKIGSHRQRSAQVPRALTYSQAYLWLNLEFLSTFAEVVLNRQEGQPPL
jgi:hypothetical protein